MSSLLKSIMDQVGPGLIGSVASKLGESETAVGKAIGAFVPTILSGMIDKMGGPGGLEDLHAQLDHPSMAGWLDDLGGLVGGGNLAQGDPRDIAGGLLGAMFGDKIGGILKAVASFAGLGNKGSSGSLIGMAGPLVMGVLAKKIASEGLGALGLKDLLLSNKEEVYGALPPSVAGLIGVTPASVAPAAAAGHAGAAAAGGTGWLKWVLPVIAVGALGWFLFGRGDATQTRSMASNEREASAGHADGYIDEAEVNEAADGFSETTDHESRDANLEAAAGELVDDVDADLEATGAEIDTLAESTGIDMSGDEDDATEGTVGDVINETIIDMATVLPGVDLSGLDDKTEGQLLRFIESGHDVCKTAECWFTMDRLTFETGSATIDMDRSAAQLDNLKAIMDAYPDLELKFGGYTDTVGSEEANLALSDRRAKAVAAKLAEMGIAGSRLHSEGYGAAFPVASNDTEDGRAQNRRIDVRVYKR